MTQNEVLAIYVLATLVFCAVVWLLARLLAKWSLRNDEVIHPEKRR